jgi:hypothetical protein
MAIYLRNKMRLEKVVLKKLYFRDLFPEINRFSAKTIFRCNSSLNKFAYLKSAHYLKIHTVQYIP